MAIDRFNQLKKIMLLFINYLFMNIYDIYI